MLYPRHKQGKWNKLLNLQGGRVDNGNIELSSFRKCENPLDKNFIEKK